MRRFLTIILLIALLTGGSGWLYWLSLDPGPGPHPIVELPDRAFVIRVTDYFGHRVFRRGENYTGWVLLPDTQSLGRTGMQRGSMVDSSPPLRPEVCRECHEDYYDRFVETAHFQTSLPATPEYVHGSFESRDNTVTTRCDIRFDLIRDGGELQQQVSATWHGRTFTHSERMDIALGSGIRGQTFLYWQENRLFELPVSWYSEPNAWANSPSYRDGTANFARPIIERCLSCHATWFESSPLLLNTYNRDTYILGVTCVRCHGDAAQHVKHHRAHPDDTEARHLTVLSELDAAQLNDVCAQCHSGLGRLLRGGFDFRPGDALDEYLEFPPGAGHGKASDPHTANQLVRLQSSRCFQASDAMTCVTCHSPHDRETGQLGLYAERCHQCHETESCGVFERAGNAIQSHCIDCHMELPANEQIRINQQGDQMNPRIRDHLIGVFPDLTESVLNRINGQ